jgi:similar to spore coat protein
MSWLDDLFGVDDSSNNVDNSKDKEVAIDMLLSSKASIGTLTKAVIEAKNPQLRQILNCQLTNSINEHFKLSDIAINKQWYNAYSNPIQQIQQDITEIQNVSETKG